MTVNKLSAAVQLAHHLALDTPNKQQAIDATMGNGYDTVFLARHFARVSAFDIQPLALERTKEKVSSFTNVTLHLTSHTQIVQCAPLPIDLVLFNLGYLPGSNKQITTNVADVIVAIQRLIPHMTPGGRIILVVYSQHNQNYDFPILHQFLIDSNYLFELYHPIGSEKVICITSHPIKP